MTRLAASLDAMALFRGKSGLLEASHGMHEPAFVA
jgi:hypothetical protein